MKGRTGRFIVIVEPTSDADTWRTPSGGRCHGTPAQSTGVDTGCAASAGPLTASSRGVVRCGSLVPPSIRPASGLAKDRSERSHPRDMAESSRSGPQGNCVEVAFTGDWVVVRDSKNPTGDVLFRARRAG